MSELQEHQIRAWMGWHGFRQEEPGGDWETLWEVEWCDGLSAHASISDKTVRAMLAENAHKNPQGVLASFLRRAIWAGLGSALEAHFESPNPYPFPHLDPPGTPTPSES